MIKKFSGPLLLLIAAFIWGSAFVAQSSGAEHVEPFTFICLRNFLGSAVLLPVIFTIDKIKKSKGIAPKKSPGDRRYLIRGGIICGTVLCLASVLQQLGIDRGTESGKAGFITALYILLVPVFSLFLGKRVRPVIWLCVAAGVAALYLLCVKQDNSVVFSDIYVLMSAVLYTVHILVIDRISPRTDGVRLACAQFFVTGVISLLPMLLIERPEPEQLLGALPSIVYAGLFSSGIAYTFQIIAQQRTEPALASLIMSLESVFAVLTAMVVLHQVPTGRETAGCIIMFAAIIVAQLPERSKDRKKKKAASDNRQTA